MNDKRYTIKRHIKELISTTAKEYQCVVLTGPRQIGKSTLLINLFPKYNYVQLDNQKIINEAKLDPELFMQKYKSPLIIDEIQKAPILFSYIKEKIDQDEKAKFIVTGSESFELMKGIGESLSTRAAIINMSSLSIAEINKEPIFTYKPDINLFLTRRAKTKTQYEIFGDIIKGSMPDIINGNKTNIQLFYKSYIETSIIKDMKED
jgi:predicted AAA+ superfamily ATPase